MLIFFREKKWTYLLEASSSQLKAASANKQRRGFFFSLHVGFEKDLDDLSGMTVSLPKIDSWINDFIETHSSGVMEAEALLLAAKKYFLDKARGDKAILREVSIHEERGWGVSWNSACREDETFFESRHYLEYVQEGNADLRQITLIWKKSTTDIFEYVHESLRLLKIVKPQQWEMQKPQKQLSETSYLADVRLESRTHAWTLTL